MEIGEFNPNSNLKVQLDLARKILDCDCDDGICVRCEECNNRGARLAEYVIALDTFLRKPTSHLPAAWIQPEPLACEKCKATYYSEPGFTGIRLCRGCGAAVDANPNRQGLSKGKVT